MREIDRIMVEEIGIVLLQMMENAGRALAEEARRMVDGDVTDLRIVVLAGPAGNGGGGLVAARRLHNWGASVTTLVTHPGSAMADATRHQLHALQLSGGVVAQWDRGGASIPQLMDASLVLDALIGYGLRGDVREPAASMIRTANEGRKRVLSLDIPSGLDGDTGSAADPTMRAERTLTLALPKRGLTVQEARPYVGLLSIADISVPATAYGKIGIRVDAIFARGDVITVEPHERTAEQ
ncbi:MAG: NAD(P)H-hydrate epimerase [Chloroflexi bacterium]|nr:NAD(P)H-hydrate epimerase [Chloroflexota bacterium]